MSYLRLFSKDSFCLKINIVEGLPQWLSGKEPTYQCRRCKKEKWVRSLDQEDSLGVGSGNLLQYSCLENSMDRGAWQATVYGLQRVRHDQVTVQT